MAAAARALSPVVSRRALTGTPAFVETARCQQHKAGTRQRRAAVRCAAAASSPATAGKTGAQLRAEFFLAAATGKERGLPEGAFLNDDEAATDGAPLVDITWEPYGDTCAATEGSSLLKAAIDAGAMKIDNRFCLTGQCDVCIVEIQGGEVVRSCMKPVPSGQKSLTCLVLDTDDAWDQMMV